MLRKIADALQSLIKSGPYAPLTPPEEEVRDYVIRKSLTQEIVDTTCGPAAKAYWPKDRFKSEIVDDLKKNQPLIARQHLEKPEILEIFTKDSALFAKIKNQFLTSMIAPNGVNQHELEETIKITYIKFAVQDLRPRTSGDLIEPFKSASPLNDEELDAYCSAILSLMVCVLEINVDDDATKQRFITKARNLTRAFPNQFNPLDARPEIIRTNKIMNFYCGPAYSDEEIELRSKIRAGSLQAIADAEAHKKAEIKAKEEAVRREQEEEKKRQAQRLVHMITGAYVGQRDGLINISDVSGLEKKSFFTSNMSNNDVATMRSNVTNKVLAAINNGASLRLRVDAIEATRPPNTMSPQALLTICWYHISLYTDIIPSDLLGYSEQNHLKYVLLSCMIHDNQSYISDYRTDAPSMYAGAELRGRLEVLMSMKLRAPEICFNEAVSYARGFTQAPGAFGDFARRIAGGPQAHSGWATSR